MLSLKSIYHLNCRDHLLLQKMFTLNHGCLHGFQFSFDPALNSLYRSLQLVDLAHKGFDLV